MLKYFSLFIVLFAMLGCSEEVPPAHKARMFDKTGAAALYFGGDGFIGPVLGPGTHFTGLYDELRLVNCGTENIKETYNSLTADGIQFKLDVHVTYAPNCIDNNVFNYILNNISPEKNGIVSKRRLYSTYVRPSVGTAVRDAVKKYKANDINVNKDQIYNSIVNSVTEKLDQQKVHIIIIASGEIKVNNMDFPDKLDEANLARAQVTIERDKAKDEEAKVDAQIKTTLKRQLLATEKGKVKANNIDEIGAAWARNPEYLRLKMIETAGSKGNLIVTSGKDSGIILSPPNRAAK